MSHNLSILMVDEEKDSIFFFRKTIQNLAPELVFQEAHSPQEASILAASLKPSLIIMEIFSVEWGAKTMTPDHFGPGLIQKFREKTPASKIIVCSTQPDGQFGDWYVKDWGVVAYFKKPYKLEAVIEKSMELLKLPYGLSTN